jgi:alkanesulfonate monooxygenase SsuD/methylene tetrahydromethanopterin reductase-like flavin-dependent oxidoreductase (luciferase family)
MLPVQETNMVASGVSFGVHLLTRMLPGTEAEPAPYNNLSDIVDAAKQSGFASIWVTDHIVYADPWMDCLLTLSAIAGQAKEHGLTIATGVLGLPLRHPVTQGSTVCPTLTP